MTAMEKPMQSMKAVFNASIQTTPAAYTPTARIAVQKLNVSGM